MRYIALFSGENLGLARAEFEANLSRHKAKFNLIESKGKIAVYNTDSLVDFNNLAYTKEVAEHYSITNPKALREWLKPEERVRVRAAKVNALASTEEIEKSIGAILKKQGFTIDLESPSTDIKVYLVGDLQLYGKIIFVNKEKFQERKNQKRIFQQPISMHPKLARAMVNIAQAGKDSNVLDPFAGTGGILIEAGLIGANVYGIDLNDKLVQGCIENLRQFGIYGVIKQGNALYANELFKISFDAIVTDLPYGRNTILRDNNLVENFLAMLPKLLKKRGIAVIATNQSDLKTNQLKLINKFDYYIHKSLTKYIHVFVNMS